MQTRHDGMTANDPESYLPTWAELATPVVALHRLAAHLDRGAAERRLVLISILKHIKALSRELDLHIQLYGRIKSLASISSKMRRKGVDVLRVLDIIGVRIVTEHTQGCYDLVRRIHTEFAVVADEYDDYIAEPKPNGYSSLHTTILTQSGFPVEIQVRTPIMHEVSERGTARHACYKRASIV